MLTMCELSWESLAILQLKNAQVVGEWPNYMLNIQRGIAPLAKHGSEEDIKKSGLVDNLLAASEYSNQL